MVTLQVLLSSSTHFFFAPVSLEPPSDSVGGSLLSAGASDGVSSLSGAASSVPVLGVAASSAGGVEPPHARHTPNTGTNQICLAMRQGYPSDPGRANYARPSRAS